MKRIQSAACAAFLVMILACASVSSQGDAANSAMPRLLPWSEQISVREGWLAKRHAMLLDMMRKHNEGMWLVVNEEFHNDPLTEYVAPPRVYTGNRDIFAFVDAGLKKFAITGYSEETLKKFFESWDEPRPAKDVLKELFDKYQPKTIALGIGAPRGVQRSLTTPTSFFPTLWGPKPPSDLCPPPI